ncbi:MAG: hypothetical protein ACKOW9_03865 [Candidatus Paceibacterota bacterium]
MIDFSKKEKSLFKRLNTPAKIQSYLNSFPFNFEEDDRDTIRSPLTAIRFGKIHCFEGALLGAYILSLHGYRPSLLHLKAKKNDFDHVIVLFKKDGFFGALSKTNHYCLRYRDPVYKTVRELVMSNFHEYFLNKDGTKTLRSYSKPLPMSRVKINWVTSKDDLWVIDEMLDALPHYDILSKKQIASLRTVDIIERKAGNLVEYTPENVSFTDRNLSA